MRILWFTNTPSCYTYEVKGNKTGYNGGGWISSAEKEIRQCHNIELGVSFLMDGQPDKVEQNGVVYYPIPQPILPLFRKIERKIDMIVKSVEKNEESTWPYYLAKFRCILKDFKPDIIHVWGSEGLFGLIYKITNIPIVLHIQGVLNPYLNAYLPPFISWSLYKQNLIFRKPLKIFFEHKKWRMQAYRELKIYKGVSIFLGRTDWDRRVSHILNPSSVYYHVDEILRDDFYSESSRSIPQQLTIITTISDPLYKGFDLVLKTAKFLKENLKLTFTWKCYGNINPVFIEDLVGIRHSDVNVELTGVASSKTLLEAELNATLYFHPSYIDNSPNSLCEAQMLGLPVISTNVGGIPSLVENGYSGYLVPANDPYQAASLIELLFNDKKKNVEMGLKGQKMARVRHNRQRVVEQIYSVYTTLLSNSEHSNL
jgi:glycosyltransferase involved in cell wall biosynthesis